LNLGVNIESALPTGLWSAILPLNALRLGSGIRITPEDLEKFRNRRDRIIADADPVGKTLPHGSADSSHQSRTRFRCSTSQASTAMIACR
jgi:hypothetical protein